MLLPLVRTALLAAVLTLAGALTGTLTGTLAPAIAEPNQTGAAAIAAVAESDATRPPSDAPVPVARPADAGAEAAPSAAAAREDAPSPEKVEPAAKPAPPPPPTLLVDVDLTRQRMTVSENGVARHTWPVSSGRAGYRTPTGTFRPQWMAKMWYSRQYDDAPMPHSVFIHGGVAIHATSATGMLGRPASHGCIRLSPANAATFYKLVSTHGKAMTRVKVFGAPKDGGVAQKRDDRNEFAEERGSRSAPRPYARPRSSYSAYEPAYRVAPTYGYAQPRFVYPGDPPYGYRAYGSPRGTYYGPRRAYIDR